MIPMRKKVRLGSMFSLVKCGKGEKELHDLISRMPDEIILSILSRSSVKDAAVTSVLSSRWEHLWRFTTQLDFDSTNIMKIIAQNEFSYTSGKLKKVEWRKLCVKEKDKYVKWVNQVLKIHEASTLERFRVCFWLSSNNQNDIDDWLKYAFGKSIHRLELDLSTVGSSIRNPDICYTLHSDFVTQLTSLGQTHLNCKSCSSVSNKYMSLKSLCLKGLNVGDEALKCFLSTCSNLERLVVHGSGKLVNFEASGTSMLKYLEIAYCTELKSIKLSNLNLISFTFSGSRSVVSLDNLPLLVELCYGFASFLSDIIPVLFCCLSQLEVLTLDTDNAEKSVRLRDLPAPMRLKQLVIKVHMSRDESLMGFASFLKASPFLQRFVLQTDWDDETIGETVEAPKPQKCPHGSLRVVELKGYTGRASELEAALYILKNAIALEQLIIDPRDQLAVDDLDSDPDEDTIQWEEGARKRAKEQLEGIVPPHKLFIL